MESLYFWFMMGKSSWGPSRTRGFIPIVADGTVLSWLFQELLLSRHGRVSPRQVSLINPSLMLLWKCDHELALYLNNIVDVGFKLLICFHYYLTWTWFVITLIHTLMDELYLWTLCNVWHICWIMHDLSCMLVESRPFAVLDGQPGLYGLKYDMQNAIVLVLL